MEINQANIGRIRRFLFVPWDSRWNALVRDTTAKLERKAPQVWLCGRTDYADGPEGAETMRWEVLGIYSNYQGAFDRCRRRYDFIAPITLNEDFGDKCVSFPDMVWPILDQEWKDEAS